MNGPRLALHPAVVEMVILLAALNGAAAPLPHSASRPEDPAPTPGTAPAVRIALETIAVDRRGTWSAGSDVADVFPGSTGVLEKSLTLIGRQEKNPPREMLKMRARITPSLAPGAACRIRVEAETKRVVSGAREPAAGARPDRKTVTVTLQEGEDRLIEIYSSSLTEGRLALKVRCGPAEGAADPADLRLVDFSLAIARAVDEQPLQALKTDSLQAMLGREATDLVSFNVPLPEGDGGARRYRREHLEVVISPTLMSGGRVQVDIRVQGELATVSAAAPSMSHPVDHRETAVLASGEARAIDLTIRSTGTEEGWTVVRYHFDLSGRF